MMIPIAGFSLFYLINFFLNFNFRYILFSGNFLTRNTIRLAFQQRQWIIFRCALVWEINYLLVKAGNQPTLKWFKSYNMIVIEDSNSNNNHMQTHLSRTYMMFSIICIQGIYSLLGNVIQPSISTVFLFSFLFTSCILLNVLDCDTSAGYS